MTEQNVFRLNLPRLLGRLEIVDKVENLVTICFVFNSNRFQVIIAECEEDIQVDLKRVKQNMETADKAF